MSCFFFTSKSHRKEELHERSAYNSSQDLCMWLKIFPGAECRQGASWWLKARSLQLQAEGTTRVLVLHKLVSLRFGRRSKGSSSRAWLHQSRATLKKKFYFTKNVLIKCQTIKGVDKNKKKSSRRKEQRSHDVSWGGHFLSSIWLHFFLDNINNLWS